MQFQFTSFQLHLTTHKFCQAYRYANEIQRVGVGVGSLLQYGWMDSKGWLWWCVEQTLRASKMKCFYSHYCGGTWRSPITLTTKLIECTYLKPQTMELGLME